jgi:hypothetical protein
MDPKDNPTNPTPFNGGQAPDSSTPPNTPATPPQEVTVDFNQATPASTQAATPFTGAADGSGQVAGQPFSDPTNNIGAAPGVPTDPSLGTINDSPRPDMNYNPAQQASPATPTTSGYDSNAAEPSYASQPPTLGDPNTQSQMPPAGTAVSQPTDLGSPQAGVPTQVTPLDPTQNPHEQHPGHAPGTDKKTIFILAGVAAVLVIAIATLLFL